MASLNKVCYKKR